jgi:hypothetical protein
MQVAVGYSGSDQDILLPRYLIDIIRNAFNNVVVLNLLFLGTFVGVAVLAAICAVAGFSHGGRPGLSCCSWLASATWLDLSASRRPSMSRETSVLHVWLVSLKKRPRIGRSMCASGCSGTMCAR